MPVTAVLPRLTTREQRRQLTPRKAPYWVELGRGLRLGYHRTEARDPQGRRVRGVGAWILREYRGGRYVQRRLGLADDLSPADGTSVLSWNDAQKVAIGVDRPTATKPGRYTVAEAAEDYFSIAERARDVMRDRVTYHARIEESLGARPVAELTTLELRRWLADQVPETPDREARRRSQATANRQWNLLRAILTSAYEHEPDRVPSADAWQRVKPYRNVDKPRTRTLSVAEAGALLAELPPALRDLAQGSLNSGLRLGELQALRVADAVDEHVHVRHSKSGRSRRVPLSSDGARFFAKLARGKAPDALLFAPMSRIGISRAMRAACKAAGIAPPAVFHDLRRSYGSLLLNAGAPADVIQELLGHADVRMTRRAYAHIIHATLQRSVAEHLPTFKPKKKRRC